MSDEWNCHESRQRVAHGYTLRVSWANFCAQAEAKERVTKDDRYAYNFTNWVNSKRGYVYVV